MGRVKILRASAGSGKTYRLAYEYIKAVVLDPRAYASTLAVTFTNKATEEMKRRILAELNGLVSGESSYLNDLLAATGFSKEKIVQNASIARSFILHDYSYFAVSTIDKFFQKIIRGFVKELGLDFGYTVELNDDSYIGEAVDRLLERASSDPSISMLTNRILGDNIKNAKNWDIRPELIRISSEITKEKYIPLTQSATTLIENHAELTLTINQKQGEIARESEQILALMEAYGLQPSDFKGGSHSFALQFAKLAGGDIISNIASLHRAADSAEEWYINKSPKKNEILEIVPQLMRMTKILSLKYGDYEKKKITFDLLSENLNKTLLLGYISEELHRLWGDRNKLPIHQTTRLIETLVKDTAVPFIYEKAGTRYDRYMIDEFQDTSTRQWNNFVPLLDEVVAGGRSDTPVMLIGDVKQAIYRWRGGDWDILARKATDHYGEYADASEQLTTNWRSLPNVVAFNNRLLKGVVDTTDSKTLREVYRDFEQNAPSHKTGGYVCVSEVEDEEREQTILNTVADALARGYRQRDIAILVRTGAHGRTASETLLRGGYSIINQESLQLIRSEVVDTIISLLKYALDRDDMVSLAKYNKLIGNDLSEQFDDIQFLDSILLKTPMESVNSIILRLDLGHRSEQVSYLQAFYQVVFTYSTNNIPDLREFIDWWNENGAKKSLYLPSTGDAITILTIHKSKGLQFPCVIIPNCDWKLEPGGSGFGKDKIWASTDDPDFSTFNPALINCKKDMEKSHYADTYIHEKEYSTIDGINMLYVAVTRAERELYVYYDKPSSSRISFLMQNAGFGEAEEGVKEIFKPDTEEQKDEEITFEEFSLKPIKQRIRTSWDSQRYNEDGNKIETPIFKGILLHKIFARIKTIEDVDTEIQKMITSGELTPQLGVELRQNIETSFANPTIAEWFAPHWTLYNENAIMIPGTTNARRPDRVLVSDKRAVVIDYKFGDIQKESYRAQVEEYKSLLTQMGYDNVKGYLWYVGQQLVEEV